ncbi:MAG: leucyl/phenylalanyl-tRNA--protein transferase [Pseudomonadota bacterium]
MRFPAVLNPGDNFPPTHTALTEPNGLLAIGGSLTQDTLLRAYQRGIFPWFEEPQPVLWWTPDPRAVLFVDELHLSRSLKKTMRRECYRLTFDEAFPRVLDACAEPRMGQGGTWIGTEMRRAYIGLHKAGWAHSVEVWEDESLIGGLYGVCLANSFFGESMFSRRSNASKIAMAALIVTLGGKGVDMVDCQVESEHLSSLGARLIPRDQFEHLLINAAQRSFEPAHWSAPASTCKELVQMLPK